MATAQDDGLVRIWYLKPRRHVTWRLSAPTDGSRAALVNDGILFTAGLSRDSEISELQMLKRDTHDPLGPAVPLDGTPIDAAIGQPHKHVFAIVNRDKEADSLATDLVRVSLSAGTVSQDPGK